MASLTLLNADVQSGLDQYLFVAFDIGHLPRFGPEELNIGAVVDHQVKLENAVETLRTQVSMLSATVPVCNSDNVLAARLADVHYKLETFDKKVSMQLDQTVSTCSTRPVVDQRPRVPVQQPVSSGQNQQLTDRERLSNVAENQDMSVLRQAVCDVFTCVLGRDAGVNDMYIIGRFEPKKSGQLS